MDNVEAVLTGLELSGGLVVDAVLDRSFTDELRMAVRERMAMGYEEKENGHVSVGPDDGGIFADGRLLANPLLVEVAASHLGDDFVSVGYNVNVAMPGSRIQHVHVDMWTSADDGVELKPSLVIHVMLCDISEENGSTEVWPGTHRHVFTRAEAYRDAVPGGKLDELASTLPSVRMNGPAGSFMLRNPAIWHRGMPNRSAEPREMLTLLLVRADSPLLRDGPLERAHLAAAAHEALPASVRGAWLTR